MKKLFLSIALFLGLFSLLACSDSNTEKADNSTNYTEDTNPSTDAIKGTEYLTDEALSSESSNDENDNSLQGDQNERLPLEVIETGYGFASWSEDSLSYGIVLYNPNNETLKFPSIRLTARREDNTIIGTNDSTLSIIYPHQTLTIADISSFDVIQDEVYSVEFEVLEPDDWDWTTGEFIELDVINTSITNNERDDYNVTGEVSNPNDTAFDRIRLDMILRDLNGEIVGGDSTFIDGPSANGSVPFQMDVRNSILKNIEGEWEVEIYASPW